VLCIAKKAIAVYSLAYMADPEKLIELGGEAEKNLALGEPVVGDIPDAELDEIFQIEDDDLRGVAIEEVLKKIGRERRVERERLFVEGKQDLRQQTADASARRVQEASAAFEPIPSVHEASDEFRADDLSDDELLMRDEVEEEVGREAQQAQELAWREAQEKERGRLGEIEARRKLGEEFQNNPTVREIQRWIMTEGRAGIVGGEDSDVVKAMMGDLAELEKIAEAYVGQWNSLDRSFPNKDLEDLLDRVRGVACGALFARRSDIGDLYNKIQKNGNDAEKDRMVGVIERAYKNGEDVDIGELEREVEERLEGVELAETELKAELDLIKGQINEVAGNDIDFYTANIDFEEVERVGREFIARGLVASGGIRTYLEQKGIVARAQKFIDEANVRRERLGRFDDMEAEMRRSGAIRDVEQLYGSIPPALGAKLEKIRKEFMLGGGVDPSSISDVRARVETVVADFDRSEGKREYDPREFSAMVWKRVGRIKGRVNNLRGLMTRGQRIQAERLVKEAERVAAGRHLTPPEEKGAVLGELEDIWMGVKAMEANLTADKGELESAREAEFNDILRGYGYDVAMLRLQRVDSVKYEDLKGRLAEVKSEYIGSSKADAEGIARGKISELTREAREASGDRTVELDEVDRDRFVEEMRRELGAIRDDMWREVAGGELPSQTEAKFRDAITAIDNVIDKPVALPKNRRARRADWFKSKILRRDSGSDEESRAPIDSDINNVGDLEALRRRAGEWRELLEKADRAKSREEIDEAANKFVKWLEDARNRGADEAELKKLEEEYDGIVGRYQASDGEREGDIKLGVYTDLEKLIAKAENNVNKPPFAAELTTRINGVLAGLEGLEVNGKEELRDELEDLLDELASDTDGARRIAIGERMDTIERSIKSAQERILKNGAKKLFDGAKRYYDRFDDEGKGLYRELKRLFRATNNENFSKEQKQEALEKLEEFCADERGSALWRMVESLEKEDEALRKVKNGAESGNNAGDKRWSQDVSWKEDGGERNPFRVPKMPRNMSREVAFQNLMDYYDGFNARFRAKTGQDLGLDISRYMPEVGASKAVEGNYTAGQMNEAMKRLLNVFIEASGGGEEVYREQKREIARGVSRAIHIVNGTQHIFEDQYLAMQRFPGGILPSINEYGHYEYDDAGRQIYHFVDNVDKNVYVQGQMKGRLPGQAGVSPEGVGGQGHEDMASTVNIQAIVEAVAKQLGLEGARQQSVTEESNEKDTEGSKAEAIKVDRERIKELKEAGKKLQGKWWMPKGWGKFKKDREVIEKAESGGESLEAIKDRLSKEAKRELGLK